MTETGTRFWSWWEERTQTQGQTHTHPAGCISLEYSKETKNKTNQLVFLLTAANCRGTFNSLWSHKRQKSCHLLCMPGEDPVPVARATGPSSCVTLSRVPLWMEMPQEKWAPERGRGRGCCLWHAQEKTPELGRVGRGLKWGTGQVEERPGGWCPSPPVVSRGVRTSRPVGVRALWQQPGLRQTNCSSPFCKKDKPYVFLQYI